MLYFRASLALVCLSVLSVFSANAASTSVSGTLSSDTEWTLESSPYEVVDTVQVASGATLRIAAGVVIKYAGPYQIYVKGAVVANGTTEAPIVFTSKTDGVSSGATMLKFEGANLSNSQLSWVQMSYAQRALQVGGGGGEFNPGEACTGELVVANAAITHAEVRTGGYQTSAKLTLVDSTVTSATIIGQYPRSEPIDIVGSTLTNAIVHSDSYNSGITVADSVATNTQFKAGCCGANLDIQGSELINSSFAEGGGSPVSGPLKLTDTKLLNTTVNLPYASGVWTRSLVVFDSVTPAVRMGTATISESSFYGKGSGVGLELTGYNGYNVSGSTSITNSAFGNFEVGIKLTNAKAASIQTGNRFEQNGSYHIQNLSATAVSATGNYWGTTSAAEVAARIYDAADDISKGPVDTSGALASPAATAPLSRPANVQVLKNGTTATVMWSAISDARVAGYRVHYDTDKGAPYSLVLDAGNATTATLSGLTDATYYVVVTAYASEADGGEESWYSMEASTDTEAVAPAITAQPTGLVIKEGSAATFSVTATGTALAYQWKKDGSSIAGATDSTYTIDAVTADDAGSYTVSVSNVAGNVTSLAAKLLVGSADATPVGGILSSDTEWTLEGSPYEVLNTIQVAAGATLRIAAGVVVKYAGPYQIYIKGAVIANGTAEAPIVFTSKTEEVSSGATMLKFEGANLDDSQLSWVQMSYAQRAIQVGGGGGEFNPGQACTGELIVANADITRAEVRTGGYQTSARLTLVDSTVTSATIIGQYPRSEPIDIVGSTLTNAIVHSDSYNAGIRVEDTVATNTQFKVGCCGANLDIRRSRLSNSSVAEGGGSPVAGPLAFTDTRLVDTTINLPYASTVWTRSVVIFDSVAPLVKVGNAAATGTNFYGSGAGVGLELSGYNGYNIGGSSSIENSAFIDFDVGVKLTNAKAATIAAGNRFEGNLTYHIQNLSATAVAATGNYWGTTDAVGIAARIYDFNEDISKGVVDTSGALASAPAEVPLSPPTELDAEKSGAVATVSWSASPDARVVGYRVYYDTDAGSPYANVLDVGYATSATLSGLSDAIYYVSVTAYTSELEGGAESAFASEANTAVPPTITTQPADRSVNVGESVSFTIAATGTAPLRYQWKKDGVAISEATEATLVLLTTQVGDTGAYTVEVTNLAGSITSDEARLTVIAIPPTITAQPASNTITAWERASFTVSATGSAPLAYQWKKDGVAIADATGATLMLPKARAGDAGIYTVEVTNPGGAVTSGPAVLTVTPRSFAGYYTGSLGAGRGHWAVYIRPDNTGVYLAHLQTFGVIVVADFTVDQEGVFTTGTETRPARSASISGLRADETSGLTKRRLTALPNFVLFGLITDEGLTGELDGLNESFAAAALPSTGAMETKAGLYTAAALDGASGAAYAIVAPSGETVVVYSTPAGAAGGTGVMNAQGAITITTDDSTEIALNVADGASFAAKVTPTGGGESVSFGGLVEGVASTSRLVNLSVRGPAGTGDQTLILGYITSGTGSKQVLIRAIGPTLVSQGVSNAVANPRLGRFDGGGELTDENDDWGGGSALAGTFARLGAFELPVSSTDAALVLDQLPGISTVHVGNVGGSPGVALAEVYDADAGASTVRFVNFSVRNEVGSGENLLIAGFILKGNAPKTFLIRAVGPSLVDLGVKDVLANPELTLFRESNPIAHNDDWGGTMELTAAFDQTGAFDLPAGSRDSAMIVTLPPGAYTVHVRGVKDTTGVALVEVYEMP